MFKQSAEVPHNLHAFQPATHDLLDDNHFSFTLIKIYLAFMSRAVPSVQTLDKNTRRVALEYTLKPVDIYIETN